MAKFTDKSILSDRFDCALIFASQAHRMQIRRGTEAPYISHLLQVCGLVLESGGNEDEAVSALLHDAVEDVDISLKLITDQFGKKVAEIVYNLTENKAISDKRDRKSLYATNIEECLLNESLGLSVIRVSIADKLHNLRCYSNNPQLFGEDVRDFYYQLLDVYGKFFMGEEGFSHDKYPNLYKQYEELDQLMQYLLEDND